MGVVTTYDEIRYELKDKLGECIQLTIKLQDENTWGYEDMRSNYSDDMLEVFILLQKAKKLI